ncbi:protein of unknown function (DUF4371) [Popillia japonica]|uniref:DUF4371 domain-containing protein n=1 Tax=Popillia japonica TaxID=7064 RepID=A0AAW1LR26_POPJA
MPLSAVRERASKALSRLIAVVKSLASRRLPFRGRDEYFGSPHNGNYLMCLELIAEFDPFFASHISKYGNKRSGSGGVSYLSSRICNEVITIMATKVTQQIMTEVRSSKYFSIIVDSTPDISHVDQLTFVVRYVLEDGSPVERFVEFIPNTGHTREDMFAAIETTLQKHKINVLNCKRWKVLQAEIQLTKDLKKHSDGPNTLKSLSQTRWSTCAEACQSLSQWWEEIFSALKSIENNVTQKTSTKCEAKGIRLKLERLETAFMAKFWSFVTHRLNAINI